MSERKPKGEPGEDDSCVSKIEIEFAVQVCISPEQCQRLAELIDEIVERPCNQFEGHSHWLSGNGAKPQWSQMDQLHLYHGVIDESAPVSGEPTFDSDVLFFETSCIRRDKDE